MYELLLNDSERDTRLGLARKDGKSAWIRETGSIEHGFAFWLLHSEIEIPPSFQPELSCSTHTSLDLKTLPPNHTP